ncbi:MAG: hypothetical protein FD152_1209 [Xanthobacteraceae bacterium]|nr:MAG: hypothetical protein FD152_1209 [Xanthobacteraceae bacterium]
MSYGLRVWDQLGQLGTDSSDVLGLALFADFITYVAPSAPLFQYASVTITDVDDRPRLAIFQSNFNGRWTPVAGGDMTYDAGAKTLTIRNTISFQAETFFLIMSW